MIEGIFQTDGDVLNYLSRKADERSTWDAIRTMAESDRFQLADAAWEHRAAIVTMTDVDRYLTRPQPESKVDP